MSEEECINKGEKKKEPQEVYSKEKDERKMKRR